MRRTRKLRPESPTRRRHVSEDPRLEPQPPPAPRWVKIAAIAAAVIVAAIVVAALFGGEHGPGRHLPGGGDHVPVDHAP